MHYLEETNLVISGHSGSGTTITSLILAYLLQKRYLYAGSVFRYIAEELGYDTSTDQIIDYEKKYGHKWDVLWENYVVWKVENEKNILAEAKLAGFFVDHSAWLFEVFLTASDEVRVSRAGNDERTEDLMEREEELRKRWLDLYNIDYFDHDEIRENFDLFLFNDDMSIAETCFEIFSKMRKALSLQEIYTLVDFQKLEKIYEAKGKKFFREKLSEKYLMITVDEVFSDWIEHFGKYLDDTEKEWREVVYSIND